MYIYSFIIKLPQHNNTGGLQDFNVRPRPLDLRHSPESKFPLFWIWALDFGLGLELVNEKFYQEWKIFGNKV